MRLVSYIKAFAALSVFLAIVACSGSTSNILPQATIPLPQDGDSDEDTAYLSISAPDDDGYVEITSSDDLIPVDVSVVVQVLFQDDVIDEIDAGEADESDDEVCNQVSDLPTCPDLDEENKCQVTADDYGAINTRVPARISDYVIVEYSASDSCETTSLAEFQVDETEVSQEFKKDESGNYVKEGEVTGGSNSTQDTYQKSNEYVVDVFVEKVAEDQKTIEGTGGTESNVGSSPTTAEEFRTLKETLQEKITVVTVTESTETQVKPVTESPVQEAPKILPTLPSDPSYFRMFVMGNFSDSFFYNTYGITKTRIYAVPFLKIINNELVFVVGVKQPDTALLAYYTITTDFSYDAATLKFNYTFTDYQFVMKSLPSYFGVLHLTHDDLGQIGDFMSFRCDISRTMKIMELKTLAIVKTKFW